MAACLPLQAEAEEWEEDMMMDEAPPEMDEWTLNEADEEAEQGFFGGGFDDEEEYMMAEKQPRGPAPAPTPVHAHAPVSLAAAAAAAAQSNTRARDEAGDSEDEDMPIEQVAQQARALSAAAAAALEAGDSEDEDMPIEQVAAQQARVQSAAAAAALEAGDSEEDERHGKQYSIVPHCFYKGCTMVGAGAYLCALAFSPPPLSMLVSTSCLPFLLCLDRSASHLVWIAPSQALRKSRSHLTRRP